MFLFRTTIETHKNHSELRFSCWFVFLYQSFLPPTPHLRRNINTGADRRLLLNVFYGLLGLFILTLQLT